ncbi:MAG TPA: PilW family protein, partial [Pseudomonadales bacterium]|nr:PilW family protein [Pseudomonadales bacterium]
STGDTLSVRFNTASGDGIINCLGQSNASGGTHTYVNTFSVDNKNQLVCSLDGADPVPLISGVQNFKVLYGVDPTGTGSVDRLLSADDLKSSDWNAIHSVQLTLQLVNPLANQPGQNPSINFVKVIDLMNRI